MKFFIERLREPSTWRGFTLFLTALGVSVSPEAMEYTVAAGVGLSGLLGMITKDELK
jgi:hypothetical protein